MKNTSISIAVASTKTGIIYVTDVAETVLSSERSPLHQVRKNSFSFCLMLSLCAPSLLEEPKDHPNDAAVARDVVTGYKRVYPADAISCLCSGLTAS